MVLLKMRDAWHMPFPHQAWLTCPKAVIIGQPSLVSVVFLFSPHPSQHNEASFVGAGSALLGACPPTGLRGTGREP